MNILGFLLMGIDKIKARRHAWRIPEINLFLCAVAGGAVGCTLGMFMFRHKTKHWYFRSGFPLCILLNVLSLYLLKKGL